jgi:micrococcal nuclease
MMKKLLATAFVLLLLATSVMAAPKYVASREREPFHVTTCRWAAKINPANAVYYETRDDAISAGHRPCKVCNP